MTRIDDADEAGLLRIEAATALDVSALLRAYIRAGNTYFEERGEITIPCVMVPLSEYQELKKLKAKP
jgi:hypothetical protein